MLRKMSKMPCLSITGRRILEHSLYVRAITIPARVFAHVLNKRSVTDDLYREVRLAALSSTARGRILEKIVRNYFESIDPAAQIENANRGTNCIGAVRGPHQTAYDFKYDGQRVECKSSRLRWDPSELYWRLQFFSIKPASFDTCVIVFWTPMQIYAYSHDCVLGWTRQGKITDHAGFGIVLRGSRRCNSWEQALERILSKLDASTNACVRLFCLPMQDRRLREMIEEEEAIDRTLQVYAKAPLGDLSASGRGLVLQEVALSVDHMVHPFAQIHVADDDGVCINGSRRGRSRAKCDWIRDGLRVECKSSRLVFDRTRNRWSVMFQNVKLGSKEHKLSASLFDELQLVINTPLGLYIYRHDLVTGLSSSGVKTSTTGYQICLSSSGQLHWEEALAAILAKLDNSGSQRIAFIPWVE